MSEQPVSYEPLDELTAEGVVSSPYGWKTLQYTLTISAEEWAKYTPEQQRLIEREYGG